MKQRPKKMLTEYFEICKNDANEKKLLYREFFNATSGTNITVMDKKTEGIRRLKDRKCKLAEGEK